MYLHLINLIRIVYQTPTILITNQLIKHLSMSFVITDRRKVNTFAVYSDKNGQIPSFMTRYGIIL
jgi:hypothetical protein